LPDSLIEIKKKDDYKILRLNRPKKLNSVTEHMALDLQTALKEIEQDDQLRAVILTGKGRAFCAGQDLPETLQKGEKDEYQLGDTVRRCYNPVITLLQNLMKPVIAAVNGTAAGAGANLAFACDFILAAESATFIQSFSKIGLIPDSGGTYLLPRMLGYHRALEYMMLAKPISAEQAKHWGIVKELTTADELMPKAEEFAAKLTQMPTKSLGYIKQAMKNSYTNSLEEQLELEAKLQSMAGNSGDYQEGVQAFLQKRTPEFKGC